MQQHRLYPFVSRRAARLLALPLSAALAAGLSAPAAAQSSVTIFGGMDLGVRHVHNSAGNLNAMQSGNNYTSRLGLRGEEDLGGGMKAGFWLESTLGGDTGSFGSASGPSWDRRTTLSLSGRWGEVRLGRDYTPGFRAFASTDIFGYAGAASMITLYNATASTVVGQAFGNKTSSIARTNGALQYYTPNTLGGFYLNASVSNSGGGSASGDYDSKGLRAGYAAGLIDVSGFGGRTRIESTQKNFDIYGLSGTYRLAGKGKLALGAVRMSYLDARQTNYTVGIDWPVGLHQVRAIYHRIDQSGHAINGSRIDGNDADMLALGYVHNLSKRTALYGTAVFVKNHGRGRFAVAGGVAGAPAGTNSSGYEVGLRHVF